MRGRQCWLASLGTKAQRTPAVLEIRAFLLFLIGFSALFRASAGEGTAQMGDGTRCGACSCARPACRQFAACVPRPLQRQRVAQAAMQPTLRTCTSASCSCSRKLVQFGHSRALFSIHAKKHFQTQRRGSLPVSVISARATVTLTC